MPGVTRAAIARGGLFGVWLSSSGIKRSKARVPCDSNSSPGGAPTIVLEPWEQRIVSYGTSYDGPATEPIRIWGARRLLVLARLLPLAERFDVLLLGTGLPSFWVAQMGEMQLTLGLSGWTTNDWTRGSALDLLAPAGDDHRGSAERRSAGCCKNNGSLSLAQLETGDAGVGAGRDGGAAAAGVRRPGDPRFAEQGLSIPPGDAGAAWRRTAWAGEPGTRRSTTPDADRANRRSNRPSAPNAERCSSARSSPTPVEILVDLDGRIRRGKCLCGHFRQYGIRNGPCRHMIVLRCLSAATRSVLDY